MPIDDKKSILEKIAELCMKHEHCIAEANSHLMHLPPRVKTAMKYRAVARDIAKVRDDIAFWAYSRAFKLASEAEDYDALDSPVKLSEVYGHRITYGDYIADLDAHDKI